ncbi:folylpolyglutamate synthase/dihydrofolate synthase family protein [Labilibaculum sp. K2S]|uniref:bifunctional folylpolyglutamate synthase/dihydrofolate synthase n=1 Tax=Labilibaculum sp. K2S TaxID=3056386 RepID=UPI0025A3B839|nr:folylpolyglutamate synthase/dihydrofolate synthase family protein [Labilibaculum sp. K2S]MDM8161953.1 folylpolyglutamate synthase/dihydrofolate synthase family protein [Labilibaculum sp. K2S]
MFTKLPMYQRTGQAAYKANLDTTLVLDEYFNHPHKKFKSIHVAGTNGKGSVSHTIASVLQAAGYKVGLYTSPHLKDFRERIKVDGELVSEDYVVDFIHRHQNKFEELCPSFFEMTVAMAFDFFAAQKVDVAVVEVGLGGRLDSTNIISPVLSVITNISKDHTNLLGSELAEIAGEKAGIIKKNVPVIIGEKQEEVIDVFLRIAADNKSDLKFSEDSYKNLSSELIDSKRNLVYQSLENNSIIDLSCDLLGLYQIKNIRTALCVFDELNSKGWGISKETVKQGVSEVVKSTGLLGRWQTIGNAPRVVCDTGHNVGGIKEIIEQIESMDYRKLHIVFGVVNDKDLTDILELMPKNASYYFSRADIPRALDQEVLAVKAKAYGLLGNAYLSVKEALGAAKANAHENDLVFVGGSTFVVAEVV